MLNVTPLQMAALGEHGTARFIERVTRDMRELWPRECAMVGVDAVPKLVEALVKTARELGLTIEYDVARFVNLAFALRSGTYHSAPWASAILGDADVPARIRMNRVWDEARRRIAARDAAAGGGSRGQ